MEKIKIGISIGDINGVGLEVILKALNYSKMTDLCTPIIYGSSKVVSYHKNIVGLDFQFHPTKSIDKLSTDRINVINCWPENVNITLGQANELGGDYAMRSLNAVVSDLQAGFLDGLVTAPINKNAMQMAGFKYPGHTEFLTESFNAPQSLMLMVSDSLRIGLVTNHLPLLEVPKTITRELILEKIRIMHETLSIDFGIEKPTIAVLGLNPHAGDGGVIGTEEEKIIRPAIIQAKKKGMFAMGPFPADGFFGSNQFNKFDGVLAMYHDQGLIPFKALSFGSGVNYTAGLPIVRTSPDHGTAYDIAGTNSADPGSFRKALFTAVDIARNRKEYFELKENALVKKSKQKVIQRADDVVEE